MCELSVCYRSAGVSTVFEDPGGVLKGKVGWHLQSSRLTEGRRVADNQPQTVLKSLGKLALMALSTSDVQHDINVIKAEYCDEV